MAKIYCKRIIAKLMALDDVPEKWRNEVKSMLDNNANTTE